MWSTSKFLLFFAEFLVTIMHWENHLDFYLDFFLHIFKYYGKFKIYIGKVINLSKYFSENFVWICNRLKNMLLASLKLGIFTSLWKKLKWFFWVEILQKWSLGCIFWYWFGKSTFYLILKSPPCNLKLNHGSLCTRI